MTILYKLKTEVLQILDDCLNIKIKEFLCADLMGNEGKYIQLKINGKDLKRKVYFDNSAKDLYIVFNKYRIYENDLIDINNN